MRRQVLVTHPSRQHSHQAAVGLARAGLLAGYWSGVPASPQDLARVPGWVRRRFVRYSPVPISADLTRTATWVPALRRLGDTALPPFLAAHTDLALCRLFDRWVARQLARARPAAVVACESCARSTFREAKRLRIVTILDAPSIHHQAQDAAHGFTEPASVHWRNVRLKDDEIALADHIVTVSELARRTYLDAGVAAERLHAVPLGVDFELFSAASNSPGPQEKPLTFVFAGATIYRKGIDLLVEALTSSGTFGDGARLVVVGPPAEAECELRRVPAANLERIGRVTQDELARVFSRCDCLVLPSRDDSFGMVVPEALAAGCPVIVSEMVGAKDLVRPGENGWVVPAGDTAVLGDRLRWCMAHQVEVRALRSDCRESARRVTWSAYHERVASLFEQVLTRNET